MHNVKIFSDRPIHRGIGILGGWGISLLGEKGNKSFRDKGNGSIREKGNRPIGGNTRNGHIKKKERG